MDVSNATRAGSSLSDRIVAHDDGTLSITVPPILVEGVRVRLLHDCAVAAARLTDSYTNGLAPLDGAGDRDPSTVVVDTHIDPERVRLVRERCAETVAAHERLEAFGWADAGEVTLRRDREWWLRAATAEIIDVSDLVSATVRDQPAYDDLDEWVEHVARWQEHQSVAVAFLRALQAA